MGQRKPRKSRTSRGIQGAPKGVKVSTGNRRILNQLDAWDKGKRVVLPEFTAVKREDGTEEVHAYNNVEARGVWGLPKHLRRNV